MVPMTKIDGTMLEYACHEGNARSMIGTLLGARTQDPRQQDPRQRITTAGSTTAGSTTVAQGFSPANPNGFALPGV